MAVNRPTRPCKNPHCGNTLYSAEYEYIDGKLNPVWRCTNCAYTEARKPHPRRTNIMRAIDLRRELVAEWKATDEAFELAIDAGHPSGCLLVYGSAFNYHLDSLLGLKLEKGKKLSNSDVRYHADAAKKDLAQAKIFVQRYAKIAYA